MYSYINETMVEVIEKSRKREALCLPVQIAPYAVVAAQAAAWEKEGKRKSNRIDVCLHPLPVMATEPGGKNPFLWGPC